MGIEENRGVRCGESWEARTRSSVLPCSSGNHFPAVVRGRQGPSTSHTHDLGLRIARDTTPVRLAWVRRGSYHVDTIGQGSSRGLRMRTRPSDPIGVLLSRTSLSQPPVIGKRSSQFGILLVQPPSLWTQGQITPGRDSLARLRSITQGWDRARVDQQELGHLRTKQLSWDVVGGKAGFGRKDITCSSTAGHTKQTPSQRLGWGRGGVGRGRGGRRGRGRASG